MIFSPSKSIYGCGTISLVMFWTLFFVGLGSGIILNSGVLATLLFEDLRLWPFSEKSFFRYAGSFLWLVFYSSTLSVFYLEMLSIPDTGFLFWTGLLATVSGLFFFLWSVWVLGFDETFGLSENFCFEGPYSLCRNPQATGLITHFVGMSLVVWSLTLTFLVVLHVLLLVLSAFAEEVWFRDNYGERYSDYCHKVPDRFLPLGFSGEISE